MYDLKLTTNGDLELSSDGDIQITQSVCQAVRIRLLWFFQEWRLAPELGVRYFEDILVKNPSESKIKHLIREAVMSVEEVTKVLDVDYSVDKVARTASIAVSFCTDEDTYREEVSINWANMD